MDEYTAMFDQYTDEWIADFPYSNDKAFDECDLNRDGEVDGDETDECYEKRCIQSCSTQEDRDRRTDTWCECLNHSSDVVLEQFDADSDGKLDRTEYAAIYDNTADYVNIDFAAARTETTYQFKIGRAHV